MKTFILLVIFVFVYQSEGIRLKKRLRRSLPEIPLSAHGRSSRDYYNDLDVSEEVLRFTRISGGRPVFPGEFPYIVEIRFMNNYTCAGALVKGPSDNQVIVTKGGCVTNDESDSKPNDLRDIAHLIAVGGNVNRKENSSYAQYRDFRRIYRHPEWSRRGRFDIAVIHMYEGFYLNNYIRALDLPPIDTPYPDSYLTVAGWGFISEFQGGFTQALQLVNIAPYEFVQCKADLRVLGLSDELFEKENFCARDADEAKKDLCKGDWGSPAVGVSKETGRLYLAGLYSWSDHGCGNTGVPNVFIKVSALAGWIREKSYALIATDEAPYVVNILYRDKHLCTGAYVLAPDGNEIVLTTAECITYNKDDPKPTDIRPSHLLKVRMGVWDLWEKPTSIVQLRDVERVTRHPDWSRDGNKHDIAIIIPEVPFEQTRFAQPISLPPSDDIYPPDDQYLFVTAYGNEKTPNVFDHGLRQIKVKSYSVQECRSTYETKYGSLFVSEDYSLCTQDPDYGVYGPCLDNIGAPAATMDKKSREFYLAGLFSWRDPECGKSQFQPIYTNIAKEMPFIRAHSEPPSFEGNGTYSGDENEQSR